MHSPLAPRRRTGFLLTALALLSAAVTFAQQPANPPASGAKDDEENPRARRANMTPEEALKRRSAALKEQFQVESDEEWTLISERIMKIQELRRSSMGGGAGFMAGRNFGPPPGAENGGNRSRMAPGGMGGGSPEAEALSTAIRNNAGSADLKARLDRLRESRKQNEAKLHAAQEDLRSVLNVRQEAMAVLMGLVP